MHTSLHILVAMGIAALIAIAIAAGITTQRRLRRQAAEVRELLLGMGLGFQPKGDGEFIKAWAMVKPLNKGGKATSIYFGPIAGPGGDDQQFTIFEHSYVISTGKSAQTIVHSVYAVDSPHWPEVSVTRINPVVRWFKRTFSGRPAGTAPDSRPTFEELWGVLSKDAAFVARWLTPEVSAAMNQLESASAWWAVGGKLVLLVKRRMSPEDAAAAIKAVQRVYAAVPAEFKEQTLGVQTTLPAASDASPA